MNPVSLWKLRSFAVRPVVHQTFGRCVLPTLRRGFRGTLQTRRTDDRYKRMPRAAPAHLIPPAPHSGLFPCGNHASSSADPLGAFDEFPGGNRVFGLGGEGRGCGGSGPEDVLDASDITAVNGLSPGKADYVRAGLACQRVLAAMAQDRNA